MLLTNISIKSRLLILCLIPTLVIGLLSINLVKNISKPIVTTSVNIHSEYSLNSIDEISNKFSNLNIFSGEVNEKSKGSTVIDFTLNPYKIMKNCK